MIAKANKPAQFAALIEQEKAQAESDSTPKAPARPSMPTSPTPTTGPAGGIRRPSIRGDPPSLESLQARLQRHGSSIPPPLGSPKPGHGSPPSDEGSESFRKPPPKRSSGVGKRRSSVLPVDRAPKREEPSAPGAAPAQEPGKPNAGPNAPAPRGNYRKMLDDATNHILDQVWRVVKNKQQIAVRKHDLTIVHELIRRMQKCVSIRLHARQGECLPQGSRGGTVALPPLASCRAWP